MRDHLLGCQAFLPPEPDPQDLTMHLRRRFPLGVPVREEVESFLRFRDAVAVKQEIAAFETGDHTPEHMRNDFPREYDLQTMLNEAAGRCMFRGVDFSQPASDLTVLMNRYDAEMRRLCGIAAPPSIELRNGVFDNPNTMTREFWENGRITRQQSWVECDGYNYPDFGHYPEA